MAKVEPVLEYSEMINRSLRFYRNLGIDVPEEKMDLAVISLTMPEYARIFYDQKGFVIQNQDGMATLGDAMCGAFLMHKKFDYSKTKEELTELKNALTNVNLNKQGKELLDGVLFARNNDLHQSVQEGDNNKSYATAFEAMIGFISLIDIYKAQEIFNKYVLEE